MNVPISRRQLLAIGGAAAVGAGLTGCGGSNTVSGDKGAEASTKVKLPTYVPFDGPKPDLPATSEGLPPAYKTYPKDLVKTVDKAPGDGSKISALTEIWTTPPAPMGKNPFWQALNKQLGVTLNLTLGTDPGYPDKFAAIVAGGELPDLMWIPPNQGIPHVAELLESKFTDLTEHLSGDAVKKYPNIAAIHPADVWKTAVVNGKIWGAPIPRDIFGQAYIGSKRWKSVGGMQCSNAEEFFDKAKELTQPKQNRWALEPYYVNAVHMIGEWFGVPNGWKKNSDGTLTKSWETDAYTEALNFANKLYKAGCFYPDATLADATPLFQQGTIASIVASGPTGGMRTSSDTGYSVDREVLIPFGHDGGKGVFDMSYPSIGYTAIKKGDPKRVEMLLEVVNFLCAPFGSQERLFISNGTKGDDFTFDKTGAPVPTKNGEKYVQGVASGLQTMCASYTVLQNAEYPNSVDYVYGVYKKLLPIAQSDPTLGYYSATATKVSGTLTTKFYDFVSDAVTGRKKVSEIGQAMKEWRNGGGDKMRDEYSEAIKKH